MKIRMTQDGVHLFNRNNGINVLLDEVTVPVQCRSRAPRFVSFALTNLCDLACSYCYAPKHQAMLSRSEVVDWCSELDRNGCVGVGFGGGEPTLHSHLPEICCDIAERTEMCVSFTTHGHRITESLADRLRGAVNFVRVSVDGTQETYERLRGRSFERLVNKIQIVSSISKFGINLVVNDDTINELGDVHALSIDLGASELLLLPDVSITNNILLQRTLSDWISRSTSIIQLAVADHGASDAFPIANPFSSEVRSDAFMHVNASGEVTCSSYDQAIRVPIQNGLGIMDAISKYRGKT